jgi:hypothetical protein
LFIGKESSINYFNYLIDLSSVSHFTVALIGARKKRMQIYFLLPCVERKNLFVQLLLFFPFFFTESLIDINSLTYMTRLVKMLYRWCCLCRYYFKFMRIKYFKKFRSIECVSSHIQLKTEILLLSLLLWRELMIRRKKKCLQSRRSPLSNLAVHSERQIY